MGQGGVTAQETLYEWELQAWALLCGLFRALVFHPWSIDWEGGRSMVTVAATSSSPVPITPASGYSASRGLGVCRARSWYPRYLSLIPGGPWLVSCLGTPPPQAVLVSRKGRVKALSRRSEAEQSEEQGQQPEWGGQRGQTQSLPQQDVLSLKKPSQVPTNPPDRLAATSLLPAA